MLKRIIDYEEICPENIDIKIKYSTEYGDIITGFYNEVIPLSREYKRAVGYFSSNILTEYMQGLSKFYLNNGKMRLIISPELSKRDIEILELINNEEELQIAYNNILEESLEGYLVSDRKTRDSAELFFLLLKEGTLEVKMAVPKNGIGIFHEKIGIFKLLNDEKIAIIGSNNETYRSVGANHESFNTFCSWKTGQDEYVNDHDDEFERYWSNESKKLNVYTLRDSFQKKIIREINEDISITERMIILEEDIEKECESFSKELGLKFTPYDYQFLAIQDFLNKKKGILEFATGSGKTKTAIAIIEKIKKIKSNTFIVIVVPDKTLMEQWYDEIIIYNNNILKCYSENQGWNGDLRRAIDIHNSGYEVSQVVMVTNQTMFRRGENSKFLKLLNRIEKDKILIVDELHNWSTKNIVANLPKAEYMLGLSATPFNNPMSDLDKVIEKWFEGILATYGLEEAIRDEKLVPYNYIPIFVSLSEGENEYYKKVSSEIAQLQSMYDHNLDKELLIRLELKRFERSRIIYGASEKIKVLQELLLSNDIERDKLLIYCGATNYYAEDYDFDDKEADDSTFTQLQTVNKMLDNIGIISAQYTQKETTNERRKNIELFHDGTLSTLVAIKCLDEGVDIPQIKNAVILASSTNYREYIQRRGRVLRKSEGKKLSNIYDFVVYDPTDNESHINKIERARVKEFNDLSLNKSSNLKKYKDYFKGGTYE